MNTEGGSSVLEGALHRKAASTPDPNPKANIHVEVENETLWTMSRQKKLVLLFLTLGSMKCFMCIFVLPPIFPAEAQSRGINQFVSSGVFAVYSLTQLVTTPLFGKAIPIVGARILYIGGVFISASSTILFGFLAMVPRDEDPALFLTFSFILRIAMAVGGTACLTSGYAIASSTFRDNAETVTGLMETAMGIGAVIGPALGGVLYQAGGFSLPFLLLGALGYLFIPMYFLLLENTKERTESASMLAILHTPWSWALCIVIFLAALMPTALQPIIAIRLEDLFGLGPAQVGLSFALMTAAHLIFANVVGVIGGRISESRGVAVIGAVVFFLAFLLIGPSPLTSLVQYQGLWLNLVCVALVGIGEVLALEPTYSLLMIAAHKSGMPDTVSTHGAVSGLLTTAFTMGETVAPVMGGWLVVNYGFDWATTVFAFLSLGMIIILVSFIVYDKCCSKTRDQECISKLD